MQIPILSGLMILAIGLLMGCTADGPASAPADPASGKPLVDTYWKLVSLEGVAAQPGMGARQSHLMLRGEGNLLGAVGGVNQIGGTYTLNGATLKLIPGPMTRMAGPEPLMKQESKFVELMTRIDRYAIAGDELTLSQGDKALMVFEAGVNPATRPR